MRRLVDDLLTLSKIESGQIAMGDEVVDVDKLLRDATRRTEWQAESKSIQVELESPRVATVRGDLHWLGQVFTNLLDNALKHTPNGGRVTLRLETHEHRSEALVTVHNTGSYIPPQDLPRVFERFFQVDRSRSARQQGSGLGLAIVREVVQAHGGAVDATSDPRHGTTFTVASAASRHRSGRRSNSRSDALPRPGGKVLKLPGHSRRAASRPRSSVAAACSAVPVPLPFQRRRRRPPRPPPGRPAAGPSPGPGPG